MVYVSSTHNDEDLLELIRVGSALAGYGSRKRIFCIPFFGYSTMERAVKLGEVVTAKVNCRLLSAIPNTASGNTFLFLDLHVAGLLHYFETDCVRALLTAVDLLEEALFEWLATATTVEKGGESDGAEDGGGNVSDAKLSHNLLFASADLGRPKVIEVRFPWEGLVVRKQVGLIEISISRSLKLAINPPLPSAAHHAYPQIRRLPTAMGPTWHSFASRATWTTPGCATWWVTLPARTWLSTTT